MRVVIPGLNVDYIVQFVHVKVEGNQHTECKILQQENTLSEDNLKEAKRTFVALAYSKSVPNDSDTEEDLRRVSLQKALFSEEDIFAEIREYFWEAYKKQFN